MNFKKSNLFIFIAALAVWAQTATAQQYPVVDTGQTTCYGNSNEIACPAAGEAFYGQDAQHTGNAPAYVDNGDGTVTDQVTGLMWQQSPDTDGDGDIDAADKLTYDEAVAYPDALNVEAFAGYTDWRLPTIKESYSLILFSGVDPSGYEGTDTSGLIPFIDTNYFDYAYGDTDAGERIIDSQWASTNLYVGNTGMLFGVNFADGRIKGYGLTMPFGNLEKTFFTVCVRGNTSYGINDFSDNGDGTVTDNATELMWSQNDSGEGLHWEEALAWVEARNAQGYLGHDDWRLPNVKELQSILDYTRSPDTTSSAAIDPVFDATSITNEADEIDYPSYWSGTTHSNWTDAAGSAGAYVSFGRAMGYMENAWRDVHGAGAQRSDPKAGDPDDWPTGHGPQGDAIRIYNYVRLVRTADAGTTTEVTAAFTFHPSSPEVSETVTFNDTSAGEPTSWEWDFGDGESSTDQSPQHDFAEAGTFTVSLTVSNDSSSDTTTLEVTVTDDEPSVIDHADLAIPATARVQGAGAFFTSRVDAFNASDDTISVDVIYTPRTDIDGTQILTSIDLESGQMVTIDDPLGSWFGIGNDEDAVGSLMFSVTEGSASDLMITSVVTALNSDGSEYGQAFPAKTAADALAAGETAYLSTTVDGERMRVNFGAMAWADDTVIEVRPVDPADTALADAVTTTLDLGQSFQINDIATSFSLGEAENYLLEATITTGSAVVYASVLDGNSTSAGTSDPTTIQPVTDGAESLTLLELGPVQGYDDFSGSAGISNLSDTTAQLAVDFYRRGTSGITATESLDLPAGDTVGFKDIVGDLFGMSDVGTVVIRSLNSTELMATGREFSLLYDDQGDLVGTAGQLIPGMTDDELTLPGTTYNILGLQQYETEVGRERSHIAAFNPGDDDVEIGLTLYDGATGEPEGETTLTVAAGELEQTNNIIAVINPDQDGAPKRLELTADGGIFVKAFRVNPTGDPVTIDTLTGTAVSGTSKLVDTGQTGCYDDQGIEIDCPGDGEAFYGQDAQFTSLQMRFEDNGNDTVADLNTGLQWQQDPSSNKYGWADAQTTCESLSLADHDDWRTPSLKELFSISDFEHGWPYIDTDYFSLVGAPDMKQEQYWSSNYYEVGTTHDGAPSAIGINHGTGHIKAYPDGSDGSPMAGKYVRCVRGDAYGINEFSDNGDGTVSDASTELMWQQDDNGEGIDWENALNYCSELELADRTDWRLPNVKEMQSVVDYSGSLPAIDTLFSVTSITNEAGDVDYPYFWTSTSAYFGTNQPEYYYAWYVAFGYAVDNDGQDTHGAGAVRFDTKVEGGPLGEGGERYYNFVRCVRDQ